MNRGTEDLEHLLKVIENMTTKEYEQLYDEFSTEMPVLEICRSVCTYDDLEDSFSADGCDFSESYFTIENNYIYETKPTATREYKKADPKFKSHIGCNGGYLWINETALAA